MDNLEDGGHRKAERDGIQVKVLLGKELTKKFMEIKERYALRTNAEVLRFCINEEHRRIKAKQKE